MPKSSTKKFKKEEVDKVLVMGTNYITMHTVYIIIEFMRHHFTNFLKKNSRKIPKEWTITMYNVDKRVASETGYLTNNDGSKIDWKARRLNAPRGSTEFHPDELPFTSDRGEDKIGFSFSSIYYRNFPQKKKIVDMNGNYTFVTIKNQDRFREAGINPYLAQDVKRLLNPLGIKVMDISNRDISSCVVYKITVFPFENNFRDSHPTIAKYLSGNMSPRSSSRNNSYSSSRNNSYSSSRNNSYSSSRNNSYSSSRNNSYSSSSRKKTPPGYKMDLSQKNFPSLSKNDVVATPDSSPNKTSWANALKTPTKPKKEVESKEEVVKNLEDDFDMMVEPNGPRI